MADTKKSIFQFKTNHQEYFLSQQLLTIFVTSQKFKKQKKSKIN